MSLIFVLSGSANFFASKFSPWAPRHRFHYRKFFMDQQHFPEKAHLIGQLLFGYTVENI